MISISVQNTKPAVMVIPSGRLDSATVAEFDQAIRPLIEEGKYLIVDLSQCTYLSSAGIRVLLLSHKNLMKGGGGFFLCGLKPEILQILEIAGLQNLFRILDTPGAAQNEIERIQIKSRGSCEWTDGAFSYQFHSIENQRQPALIWKNQGIAGYDELNYAVGTGSPAETPDEDEHSRGLFMTNGSCAGLIPDEAGIQADFRIPLNPGGSGIFTGELISFSRQPTGLVRLMEDSSIRADQLADGLYQMKRHLASGLHDLSALLIADYNPEMPSVSICLLVDREMRDTFRQFELSELSSRIGEGGQRPVLWGARFVLDQVPPGPQDITLSKFLENTLTFENIIDVRVIQPGELFVNPIIWMFVSHGLADAATARLHIETDGGFLFLPPQEFLARRLYTDSARLLVKQLHGGYSAQTYQVISYDRKGRKLRPTVLKLAGRVLIMRESDRCQQYAMPYILNNSAMVLGTEFYGDTGALRYNFVGIGGEQTQLKWLAHYFSNWPINKLEPLFDKIFLQILNPWYGQPIEETIFPYRDHDPTLTFFPDLCKKAEEIFLISSDDQYFTPAETGRQIINPYWFLKHEFTSRREIGIAYFTSICHGDLNMQNILLDEDMNVYLIDFSETKPRSIISDFARLEAIYMIEHAATPDAGEVEEYIQFLTRFYADLNFTRPPENSYEGKHREKIARNVNLALKMRQYAFNSVNGNPDPVPYCLALLEWILPVVCYQAPAESKRYSMIAAGLLCELVLRKD